MSDHYDSILLYSGGLESYIAWHYLDYPQTVYFDIGNINASMERRFVIKNAPKTILDECLAVENNSPFKTLILTVLAASKYSDTIYIGGGATPDFLRDLSFMLCKLEGRPIKVSLAMDGYKADKVDWFLSNIDGHISLARSTYSCLSPGLVHHCGLCDGCKAKMEAFASNGISL